MNLKNLKWSQVAMLCGIAASAVSAIHFRSPLEASIASVVAIILAWLAQSPSAPSKPEIAAEAAKVLEKAAK